jgi:hypothetical protein
MITGLEIPAVLALAQSIQHFLQQKQLEGPTLAPSQSGLTSAQASSAAQEMSCMAADEATQAAEQAIEAALNARTIQQLPLARLYYQQHFSGSDGDCGDPNKQLDLFKYYGAYATEETGPTESDVHGRDARTQTIFGA